MRLSLFNLIVVYLVLIPRTLAKGCTPQEQDKYLRRLNFEQSQIGILLARVQESYTGHLDYYDLTQRLLTLETSDLHSMLREGRKFAETILDSDTLAAQEFNLYADFSDKTRLAIHAGQTLLKLRRLEKLCGEDMESLPKDRKVNLMFVDVVSSFAKYKIHLRNLISGL